VSIDVCIGVLGPPFSIEQREERLGLLILAMVYTIDGHWEQANFYGTINLCEAR